MAKKVLTDKMAKKVPTTTWQKKFLWQHGKKVPTNNMALKLLEICLQAFFTNDEVRQKSASNPRRRQLLFTEGELCPSKLEFYSLYPVTATKTILGHSSEKCLRKLQSKALCLPPDNKRPFSLLEWSSLEES